jgi:acetyl esterase/lipase
MKFNVIPIRSLLRFSQAAVCCLILLHSVSAAEKGDADTKVVANIAYKSGESLTDYERERCKLDLYLPENRKGFACLVWFHGGGMTGGNKGDKGTVEVARAFVGDGIAVAAVNYRLSPKATYPSYVEDAAAAVAWIHEHIAEHGGDPEKVFVGGHSAGGYLTSLLGMDARYLRKLGMEPDAIAGLIPVSGQMMTHFTVRAERGIGSNAIVADEAAPIYYARKETPPFLIIMGDHDWPARAEENQYFVAVLKSLGNTRATFLLVPDRNHGSIAGRIPQPGDPAREAILLFIRSVKR